MATAATKEKRVTLGDADLKPMSLKEAWEKLLAIGIVMGFFAVIATGVWFVLPEKIQLHLRYSVPYDKINIDKRPHDCDWAYAPIGDKACHYKKEVGTIRWATSTTGNPIISVGQLRMADQVLLDCFAVEFAFCASAHG